jgi:CBS domain containing-hemolysin-like protein
MTPARDIVAVERREPAMAVMRRVADSKVSRMPVYEGDLDHIVGLVHSFDVFARPDAPLSALRRVTFAPPDASCHDLMRRLLRERVHLAIIQDPAGATLGLVTLEDLVEELVGDIHDEHDDPNPVPA